MNGKKRLFQKIKKRSNGEVSLQITSMADVFTILLVFLLKGVASDAIQITPANGTTLAAGPHSQTLAEPALQIEITKSGILVEKEMVSSLEERLTKERERQKYIAQNNDTVKIDTRVIVLADQGIPFSEIKPVLKTLAAQGYSEIQFAAIKE